MYGNNFVLLTCTGFEVTANKIAQFLGTSLEPRAKGTGNGKVKKTCPFVTPMKKFHWLKPRRWLTTSSRVITLSKGLQKKSEGVIMAYLSLKSVNSV